jgi:hypothetical protein
VWIAIDAITIKLTSWHRVCVDNAFVLFWNCFSLSLVIISL